ncbi:DUF3108 domain-containing protein [Chitiniphilus shinanonensis]|uniref:DUF3108 domain-containing protein n=1 Tax=Chitiniphilus shinanonensis TaxID=553088 RepID=UPI003030D4D7
MTDWRARLAVRRWLWVALLLSVLVHLFGILGDTLYLLASNSTTRGESTPLRKATQHLAETSFDDLLLPPELEGVKPAEQLVVSLGLPPPKRNVAQAPTPTAQPTPVPTPMTTPAPSATPRPTPTPTPMPTPATPAASAPATQLASAPAALAASQAVAQATAPSPTPTARPASAPQDGAKLAKGFPRNAEIVYMYGPVPATLTWHVEHGRYEVSLKGSLLGRTRELRSVGHVTRDGLRPDRYTELRDGKMRSEATFDWDKPVATLNDKGEQKEVPLRPGDQDLFSAAFQLAMQGSRLQNPTFTLFSGRKSYPDVQFSIRGESTLRVGDQQVDVLLLRGTFQDREFDFWLAPKWHNMPVRMQARLGNDGTSYDIWASSMRLEDTVVLRPALSGQQDRGPH